APVAVKTKLGLCDGLSVDPDGNLFFLDRTDGTLWSVSKSGDVKAAPGKFPGALVAIPQKTGDVLVAKPKQLSLIEPGGAEKVLIKGEILGQPADFSVGSSGAMFFSNGAGKAIFFRTPDGRRIAQRAVGLDVSGVAYVDEKEQIYLALPKENKV